MRSGIKKFVFIFLLLWVSKSDAQVPDILQNSFAQEQQQILQEKIFVHTDKTFYLTGEILWFKVYAVDASLNKPVDISKVAYIEVLDNRNTPLLQAKVNLHNGLGSGSLYIPVTATNGNYKLRAYTNWMKNFSADFYFEQPVIIVNPLISPQTQARDVKPDNDIQFFPEGGNLVDGIKNMVAFKAVGANGKGVEVTGVIINDHNDTVAHFTSFKFGMGRFAFTPSLSHTYKAVMRIGQNGALIKELPFIQKQGYTMQVTDGRPGQLAVTINTKATGQPNETLYVFVHSGQYIKLAEGINLNNGTATLLLDKNKLGDGISHITLFNAQKKPVCERLYFKRPQQLLINATADRLDYSIRDKVNIDIDVQSEAGKPKISDLSLSVYKLDSLQTAEPAQILSYLWLKAELKGNIESADYYLRTNNAQSDEALDNLMLTQGWSRFKWQDILSTRQAPSFKFLPEYNGHIVTARVTEGENGKPVEGTIAYLGATGKRVQLYTALSDTTGHLLFDTKDFYGSNELVLQLGTEKDSVYHLDILSPFSEQYSANNLSSLNITPNLKRALEINNVAMQAQNIFNGNKLKQYYDPGIDSIAFYGKGKTYLLDDFTRFTTMEEVLREYVTEATVSRSQKHFHIKAFNGQGLLDGDPLVMLDGVPVFSMDRVMAIDPLKIKKLQTVGRRFYLGPASFEGIFSFTTYKGDLGGFEINPHAVVLDYEGMQLQREFYSPVYDTDNKTKSTIPDQRVLLYWSPDVITDIKGKTKASFYTSDEAGKYIGIIQGITATGEAGSKYFTFEVRR